MAQEVQTIIFSKDQSPSDINDGDGWTASTAKKWLKDHDFKSSKKDETDSSIRFRQFDPDQCAANSFKTLTENFPSGVSAVSCNRQEENAMRESYESRGVKTKFEVRKDDDGKVRLVGLAAIFDTLSENLGGFREQIATGAFDEADMEDVRALFNHDDNIVLGRTISKTLSLSVNKDGLTFDASLPDTQLVRDMVVAPIERGDINQSSFGFTVAPGGASFEEDEEGRFIRTITKFQRIFDVSPVTFPAYTETKVATRAFKHWCDERARSELPSLAKLDHRHEGNIAESKFGSVEHYAES